MRLVARKYCEHRGSAVLGSLLPPRPRCFQRTLVVFPRCRPPAVASQVHPPVSSTSSTENYPVVTRPSRRPRPHGSCTFHGVSFLFAAMCGVHSQRASHCPSNVPPSAFLTLSTVYSSAHFVGLFHPTATSRIRTSGVFPATEPTDLSIKPFPLVVGEILLPVSKLSGARSSHPPSGL